MLRRRFRLILPWFLVVAGAFYRPHPEWIDSVAAWAMVPD